MPRPSRLAILTGLGAGLALTALVNAQLTFPPSRPTIETLSTLSTAVYIGGFKDLFGFEPGPPAELPGGRKSAPPSGTDEPGPSALTTVPLFTEAVNNDAQQDVETSIMSNLTSNATSVGYIKRLDSGVFRNYVGYTADFFNWTNNSLALPAGYACSADPLQHANVFDNGIAPRRTYLAGIIYNGSQSSPCSPFVRPNAIGVWRSDSGGASWSGPTLVAVNSSNSAVFLDKPDVEVAWYTTTRGNVYVAYVESDLVGNPDQSKIFVARSTDGGVTFGAPVWVASSSGWYTGPQMLASTVGTRIYVLFSDLNPTNERLLMSWSDNQGASWTAPEQVATGDLLRGLPPDLLNGDVRAVTLPMARYNGARNAIGVVWHERAADGTTDIYFATKTTTGWKAKKRINPVTTNDQFMPALDYDLSGNYLVTYYDRSGDPNNLKYREKWVKIDYLGTILESGEVADGFESDPTQYTNAFIGDYQDVWWWSFTDMFGDRFNAAWAGRPATTANPYVSGIQ